jgi:site-specific DNA recombinase
MIAAIYARKSTEQNVSDDEKSVSRQIETARAFAARRGWTVADKHVYVDDAVSGAEWKGRHALNALLATLEPRAPFQALIVSEISRIGRDAVRTPAVIQQIEEADVEVWAYLTNQRISLADESSELQTIFGGLASATERRRASQRTYDALRRKAERGLVTGGRLYGYDNVRSADGVRRVVNPEQAAVVRRIFELYADGLGLAGVAARFNADRVPGPRGGTWSFTAIREMVRNEAYKGVLVWNRLAKTTRRGKAKVRKLRPESEWKRIEVPAWRILDEALWNRVQRRIAENGETYIRGAGGKLLARPARGDGESPYALSGFITCGQCGGPVTVSIHPSGGTPKPFLRCANRAKRGLSVCGNTMTVKAELLDVGVLDVLAEALQEHVITRAVEGALAALRAGQNPEAKRAAVEREITDITTRERHFADAIGRGEAPDVLLAALRDLQARRKVLEEERAALVERGRLVALTAAEVSREVAPHVADLRALLAGASVPQVRQLLRALGVKAVVRPDVTPEGRVVNLGVRGDYRRLVPAVRELVPEVVSPTGFEGW